MAKPNMLITAVRGKFLACLLLPLTMFLGCTPQDKPSQQVSRPVKVVRIGEEAVAGVMSFAGEVRARYETILAFRVSGKMIDRPVEVGDRVHKGQRVARLDSNDYQLGTDALNAQLKSAQAERDFARDDLTRYRELLNLRVISPAEFDRHDTAYTTARERVVALEAQLSQATNQLQYTDLLADRDGVVTAVEVETGQVVTAGQPVVKLARLDEKEIHIDIPEQRVGGIELRQKVSVTLWADGDRRYTARIREIAAAADPTSRTYRVKATLLEGQDEARLGKTATVWIPVTHITAHRRSTLGRIHPAERAWTSACVAGGRAGRHGQIRAGSAGRDTGRRAHCRCGSRVRTIGRQRRGTAPG